MTTLSTDVRAPRGAMRFFLLLGAGGCFHDEVKPDDTGSACVPIEEIPYDGVDQDCDGADLTDVDGDGFEAAEVGSEDCDDGDAAIYPGAVETPYDGVDQDCDGVDLTDVDGDGYDAAEVGGEDCDDDVAAIRPGATEVWYDGVDQDCDGASDYDQDCDGYDCDRFEGEDCDDRDAAINPGATEIPYDGIDQDCDGLDPRDEDGDGYDAVESGGDDCDDSDPAIHPGVPEVQGDGVDNDCDGRGDEYVVCADGSGDFTTLQAAIDDAPPTSVLELCPGVYEEDLDVTGKDLDIEGGGESPDDVVLRGVSDSYHVTTGTGTNVRFYWLAMESNGSGTQNGFSVNDTDVLTIDTVDLCGSGNRGYLASIRGSCSAAAEISLTRSSLCNDRTIGYSYLVDLVVGDGCIFSLSQCILVSDDPEVVDTASTWKIAFDIGHGRVTFANNLFVGGSYYLGGDGGGEGLGSAEYRFTNNTFANVPGLMIVALSRDGCHSIWPFDMNITNNIFYQVATYNGYGLWNGTVLAYDPPDHADLAPTFDSNLLWSISTPLATTTLNSLACAEGGAVETDSVIVSTLMSSASILSDPLFLFGPTMGSYDLGPASPAVDMGSGPRDPDGTLPDLGAFGGPDGDWWQEVPWQLP